MKTIIIIGMHRSGTSLTASLLHHSGLNIGKELLGSATGNLHGHYENIDFYTFHMKMLKKLNLSSSGWDNIEIEQFDAEDEAEAKKIIEHNQSALWGWKDPRTTLFINVWAKLLPHANFLFVYRSPVEVVDSLYRRGTDKEIIEHPEIAMDTWLHYNKLVLENYKKYKERSLLINVESLIHAYPECIKMINARFNTDLHPEAKSIFNKNSFTKNTDGLLWTRLLYNICPEVKQVYEELNHQSWQPSGIPSVDEDGLETDKDLFRKLFFNHWKETHTQQSQLNAYKNGRSIHEQELMIREKDRMILALEQEVAWMKKTKFWKLRAFWQKVKSYLS